MSIRVKVVNCFKPVIGVVGAGTVGSALEAAFEGCCEVLIADPALGAKSASLTDLASCCRVIFISVPTPAGIGGEADLDVLYAVVQD